MPQQYTILMVEDSNSEIELNLQAIRKAGIEEIATIDVARTGQEALEYLSEKFKSASKLPDIILLDLALPGVDGKEVLKHIKSDSNLDGLRVIVFSSSDNPRDFKYCLNMKADCYYQKPSDFRELVTFFHTVKSFLEKDTGIEPTNLSSPDAQGLPGLRRFSRN